MIARNGYDRRLQPSTIRSLILPSHNLRRQGRKFLNWSEEILQCLPSSSAAEKACSLADKTCALADRAADLSPESTQKAPFKPIAISNGTCLPKLQRTLDGHWGVENEMQGIRNNRVYRKMMPGYDSIIAQRFFMAIFMTSCTRRSGSGILGPEMWQKGRVETRFLWGPGKASVWRQHPKPSLPVLPVALPDCPTCSQASLGSSPVAVSTAASCPP